MQERQYILPKLKLQLPEHEEYYGDATRDDRRDPSFARVRDNLKKETFQATRNAVNNLNTKDLESAIRKIEALEGKPTGIAKVWYDSLSYMCSILNISTDLFEHGSVKEIKNYKSQLASQKQQIITQYDAVCETIESFRYQLSSLESTLQSEKDMLTKTRSKYEQFQKDFTLFCNNQHEFTDDSSLLELEREAYQLELQSKEQDYLHKQDLYEMTYSKYADIIVDLGQQQEYANLLHYNRQLLDNLNERTDRQLQILSHGSSLSAPLRVQKVMMEMGTVEKLLTEASHKARTTYSSVMRTATKPVDLHRQLREQKKGLGRL